MSLKQIHEQLLESGEIYWPLQVEIEELEVRAWAIWAEGDKQRALRQLESAAELEDGTEKNAVTPGPLAPGRELLGEMLLAANQPTHALEQFESTLKKEPGRFRALYGAGKAAQLARRYQLSRKYFGELLKVCERADRTRRAELLQAEKAVTHDDRAMR